MLRKSNTFITFDHKLSITLYASYGIIFYYKSVIGKASLSNSQQNVLLA